MDILWNYGFPVDFQRINLLICVLTNSWICYGFIMDLFKIIIIIIITLKVNMLK